MFKYLLLYIDNPSHWRPLNLSKLADTINQTKFWNMVIDQKSLFLEKSVFSSVFQHIYIFQHNSHYVYSSLLGTKGISLLFRFSLALIKQCTAVQVVYNPFNQFVSHAQLYSQLQLSLRSDPNAFDVPASSWDIPNFLKKMRGHFDHVLNSRYKGNMTFKT